jgi:hypothetical protein
MSDDLRSEVNELKQITSEINAKLDKLLELFEIQTTDCKKMSQHIDFVETIYESVKNPFNFIMRAVDKTLVIKDSE